MGGRQFRRVKYVIDLLRSWNRSPFFFSYGAWAILIRRLTSTVDSQLRNKSKRSNLDKTVESFTFSPCPTARRRQATALASCLSANVGVALGAWSRGLTAGV